MRILPNLLLTIALLGVLIFPAQTVANTSTDMEIIESPQEEKYCYADKVTMEAFLVRTYGNIFWQKFQLRSADFEIGIYYSPHEPKDWTVTKTFWDTFGGKRICIHYRGYNFTTESALSFMLDKVNEDVAELEEKKERILEESLKTQENGWWDITDSDYERVVTIVNLILDYRLLEIKILDQRGANNFK